MSGYLYRSAVLFYDRETETFWSQMTGDAVVGPQTGRRLEWLPSVVTTWREWRESHPETTVLKPVFSMQEYERSVRGYARYERRGRPMFPVGPHEIGKAHEPMDLVTVIEASGRGRCYPHKALSEGRNEDGDLTILKKGITVRVLDREGKDVPSLSGYWFAFCAFYPEGTVWEPKPASGEGSSSPR